MCEMLVMREDKVNDDPYLDAQCYKRGDVIVIMEDGHPWSKEELDHPRWLVVKVPGVPRDKLTAYLVGEPGDPLQNKMLQRRAFTFDMDAHDQEGKKDYNEAKALEKKKAKPARADPLVLGDDLFEFKP